MTQKIINLGTADKGNGDPIRVAFSKVNDNFTELYSSVSQSNFTELSQDYVAQMFLNGDHVGVSVEYNDNSNKLNIIVEQDVDGGAASTFFDDAIAIDGGGA